MFEWSEEQLMVRDAVRRFIEAEVVPHIEALEHGDVPPYDDHPQAVRHLRHGPDGPRPVQEAARAQGGRHHRVGRGHGPAAVATAGLQP